MKLSFFIILFLLFGCSKKHTEIPPEVLSEDQMVRVLIDVHLLEAKIKKLYLNHDSSKAVYYHYEEMLFEDLGISKEKYEHSLEFYVDETETFYKIYNRVADSLLARSKSLDID